jgi:RimJ/RimL family protein N-acetyltransferase
MKQISDHGGALLPIQARQKAEALLEDWARHGYGMFIISLRSDPAQPIGYCGFKHFPETGLAELGYILDRPWWGKGLALEAARGCLELARNELNLKRLVAITHPQAAASQKILSRLGFKRTSDKDQAPQGSDHAFYECILG